MRASVAKTAIQYTPQLPTMSEGRLQHLLQPIRDLSKNWNIDLASELEEYMDKLENLSIAFDPEDGASIAREGENAGVMNFAEAALLIQGTSVIYSRKVEYLHALVYQTLAHLSKQQDDKQQKQQSGEQVETQEEEEGDADTGVFNNPLPLYDELDEAKRTQITLRQVDKEDEETENGRRRKRKEARELNRSKNNIQASIALMGSLVPDERDHGDAFKLLSCNLHATGVLLLDEASKKYLRPQQQAIGEQSLAFGETPGRQKGMWVAADGENPAMALNFDDLDAADDDDGDDNGFEEQPDYEYDNGDAMDQDVPVEDTVDIPQHEDAPAPEPSFHAARSKTALLPIGEKDPWAPLDAYDASTSVARPFRKGRSYPKVPAYKKKKAGVAALSNKEGAVGLDDDAELDGLSDPSFQERFFMGSNGPQWASWIWTETSSENPLEKTCKRTFCKAPLLVKSCDALWQREAKWRSAMRRCEAREKQSAEAMLLREQAMEEEEAEGNDQAQALTLSTATARLDMAFRNDANGNNEDEDDDNGDDNAYDDGFDGGDWDQGNDMDDPMGSYEATAAASSSAGGALTYEEICRQHLASFMSGTEKYVRETDLSKQVSDWQEKLTPLLKQQDAHPPFDIHHYGREIIDRLEEEQKSISVDKHNKSTRKDTATNKRARVDPVSEDDEEAETVPFETLVDGKSQFEVCRLFLASLQLANSGNVALSHAHTTADHGKVPFEMKLLSTANVYEALQA